MDKAFKLLRIDKQAGPEEIRRAYVRLARRYPPEQFPEKFAAIHQAYGQLTLEPEAVTVFLQKAAAAESALELAGLLWGDRAELQAVPEPDFTSLEPLLAAGAKAVELEGLLAELAPTIEWQSGEEA